MIYSPDQGVTWHNQDGTHPVVWENWNARSSSNMLFYDEAFLGGTFLHMGKDYGANEDGYVYVYDCNPELDAEQLFLARVAKSKVADRKSYEFFSGRLANGNATWTGDVKQRVAVHTFPAGRVSRGDADGKSFWLIWSDYAYKGSGGEVENPDKEVTQKLKGISDDRLFAQAFKEWTRRHQPNAYFNFQRVDLIVESRCYAGWP